VSIFKQDNFTINNLIGDGSTTSFPIELTELPLSTRDSLLPFDGSKLNTITLTGIGGTVTGTIVGTILTITIIPAPSSGAVFALSLSLFFPLD
jgi:hypothetical protein